MGSNGVHQIRSTRARVAPEIGPDAMQRHRQAANDPAPDCVVRTTRWLGPLSNCQSTATVIRSRAALLRLLLMVQAMKKQIAVKVNIDVAKVITALTGLVLAIATIYFTI